MTTTLSLLLAASLGAADDVQLLVFSAPYCGACVGMEPALNRMQAANYPIKKINISQNPNASRSYSVKLLPTFVVLKNGQEVERHVGATSERALRNMVLKHARTNESARSSPETLKEESGRRRNPLASVLGLGSRSKGNSRARNNEPDPVFRGNNPSRSATEDIANVPALDGSQPVAASVRIRVQDGNRTQMGSGTIVSSQPGNTIVLTCAHLVDEVSPDAEVTIEVFADGRVRRFRGKTLSHDIKSDVALMSLLSEEKFPVAPLASRRDAPNTNDDVFSVGCGGGSVPTRQNMQIVEINRYRGPANIECSTVPAQGRSGGALFNKDGKVIGVCSAADEDLNEGIYAGPEAIYTMLSRLTSSGQLNSDSIAATATPRTRTAIANEAAQADDTLSGGPAEYTDEGPGLHISRTSPEDAVRNVQGAEVTCLIRPREAGGKSRVVIIHRASDQFVRWLEGELEHQPRATMYSTSITTAALAAQELTESAQRSATSPMIQTRQPVVTPRLIPSIAKPEPYQRTRTVRPRSAPARLVTSK